MTCKDVIDAVEAIAAGDLEPGDELRAHLESCPGCASVLASARRLETALARREAPQAPQRFAAVVLQRVRREQWRAEQRVDRLFNVAMVVALVVVAGGAVALMNLSGILAGASQILTVLANVPGGTEGRSHVGDLHRRRGAPRIRAWYVVVGGTPTVSVTARSLPRSPDSPSNVTLPYTASDR